MHFHSIRFIGLGPFADNLFEFVAPGLNVITGDDKTGKSTLCQALSAVLYGFPDRATAEAHRSWVQCDTYRGEVDLAGKGGRYRVERDFATDRVRVVMPIAGGENELFNGNGDPHRAGQKVALAYKKLLSDEDSSTQREHLQ